MRKTKPNSRSAPRSNRPQEDQDQPAGDSERQRDPKWDLADPMTNRDSG